MKDLIAAVWSGIKRPLIPVIAALALTLGATPAHAAQDPGSLPPTCDYERWWFADVCGTYPWTVSIKAECQQLDPKVAAADPVCRKYVRQPGLRDTNSWYDGGMTKRYWVDNCQRQRLGLKGRDLAAWRHWCHGIKPLRQHR